MGRPLNKKFFGNTNLQDFGTAGVGGESVASVAVTGTFDEKTPGTYAVPDTVISAPQITGGAKPTLTLTYLTATTATVTVVTPGSGYTSAPTISGAGLQALGGAGTGEIVLTAALTTGAAARQNAIKFAAQIGNGGEVTTGDIIKQSGSRRYRVQTSDGIAICKLVTTADLGANEMSITATDTAGGTYFVRKLTARKAILVRGTGTQFATGGSAKWTFGDPVLNTTVKIDNQ